MHGNKNGPGTANQTWHLGHRTQDLPHLLFPPSYSFSVLSSSIPVALAGDLSHPWLLSVSHPPSSCQQSLLALACRTSTAPSCRPPALGAVWLHSLLAGLPGSPPCCHPVSSVGTYTRPQYSSTQNCRAAAPLAQSQSPSPHRGPWGLLCPRPPWALHQQLSHTQLGHTRLPLPALKLSLKSHLFSAAHPNHPVRVSPAPHSSHPCSPTLLLFHSFNHLRTFC